MKGLVSIILIFVSATCVFAQSKIRPKLYAKEAKEANSYFEMNDYLKALNAYRKVIAIDAQNETAHLNSLICRINLGQLKDSLKINAQPILSAETPEAKFYLGRFEHLSSNFEAALKYYNDYKIFQ